MVKPHCIELDYFPIDKLAKSLPFEGRIWGFEALSEIKSEFFSQKKLAYVKNSLYICNIIIKDSFSKLPNIKLLF